MPSGSMAMKSISVAPASSNAANTSGIPVAEQVPEASQQRVGVADLRRAATVPLEGAPGVGGQRRGVPLDQRDPMALPATS